MLTREWMGVLALGILWVNTLLVAGAALQRVAGLLGLARRIAHGVRRGRAPRALASVSVDQVGRYGAGAKRAIVWHDRAYASAIAGGEVTVGDGESLVVPATTHAMVWVDEPTVRAAADLTSTAAFDEAYASARKAKGFARKVVAEVGDDVFVANVRTEQGDAWLVSTFDPVAWCRSRALVIAALFVPALLAIAAGVTVVALWPPAFGTVSMVGAFMGVVYFLLVLPAGTAIRDWARLPHERILRGAWKDPEGRSTTATETGPQGKASTAGSALMVAPLIVALGVTEVASAQPFAPSPSGPLPYANARPVQRTRFRGSIGGGLGMFASPETDVRYYQAVSMVQAKAGWQFNDVVAMYAMGGFGFGAGEDPALYGTISWMSELTFEDRLFWAFGFDMLFVGGLDDTRNRTGLLPFGGRFRLGGYPLMFGKRNTAHPRRRGLAVGADLGVHPFPEQLMLMPTAFVSYEVF